MSSYESIVKDAQWSPEQQVERLRGFVRQIGHEHTLVAVLAAACDAERVRTLLDPALLVPRVSAALIDGRTDERFEFDATPWFATATPGQIARLVDDEFGRALSADEIAEEIARSDPHVATYLAAMSNWEAQIAPASAWAWIDAHCPAVAASHAEERGCDLARRPRPLVQRER